MAIFSSEIDAKSFQELITEQKKATKGLNEISTLQKKILDVGREDVKQSELFGPPMSPEQQEKQNKKMQKVRDAKAAKKDKEQLSFFGQIANFILGSKSRKKEDKKEESNRFGLLGRKFSEGFKGFKDSFMDMIPSARGVGEGFMGMLKKAALIGFILMLPKILNSQFAKDTVKFLEEKIPIVFEKLKGFFKTIVNGFGPLIDFTKERSWENFKALFNADTGIAAGLTLLTASLLIFGPGKILKSSLGLAVKAFKLGLKGIGAGLALLGGGDKDKDKKTKKTTKKATKGLKGFSKIGKIAKIGAKAIPGVGLIATAAFGIFDGVVAGLEEAKKETATVGSIARESVSGVLSGLTFGLVSQETFSEGFKKIGTKFEEGANFLKDGFNTGLEFIKGARIPTMEEVGEGITTAGLAIKGAYAKVGGKLLETKDMLTKSFEDVTGIDLPEFSDVTSKLKEFGSNLKERALSFIPSKESILKFGGKIKNFVADKLEGSEEQQDKIKQAVDDALKLHFETDHVADKIQENAMNKYQDSSAAASPVLVSNNSSSNNTNNYSSHAPRVTANDTSTMHIIEQR